MRRLLLPTELKACVNAPPGWHRTEGQRAVVERARPTAMAGNAGFEPAGLLHPAVFRTVSIDHSDNFPDSGGSPAH